MTEEKLEVKSTDLLILRVDMQAHSDMDAMTMAQALHEETGAFVLLLGPGETIEQLPEEEARRLWQALQERFG